MKATIEDLILIAFRSAALLVLCVMFMGHSSEAKAASGQESWGSDNCAQTWDGYRLWPSNICRYFLNGDTQVMFEQYDKSNYNKPAVHMDYSQVAQTGWVYAYTDNMVIAVPWRGSYINVLNVEPQSFYFWQDGSWITIPQIQALIAQKLAAQTSPQIIIVGGSINWDDPVMKLAALIDKAHGIQDY
jgi:hypothetical protein